MLIDEINMSDDQKQLKSEIGQTKAALKDKSRELLNELQETAHIANMSVREKIEETKQLFNISNYIKLDKHPWLLLGSAVLAGVLLSRTATKKNSNDDFETTYSSRPNPVPEPENVFSELKKNISKELVNLGKAAVTTLSQELSDVTSTAIKDGISFSVGKARSGTGEKSQESGSIYKQGNV